MKRLNTEKAGRDQRGLEDRMQSSHSLFHGGSRACQVDAEEATPLLAEFLAPVEAEDCFLRHLAP